MRKMSQFNKLLKISGVALLTSVLMSCSSNTEDLKDWVEKVKQRPPGRIEPMPDIVEYKPHDYSAAHKKSPFSELQPELEEELTTLHEGCDATVQPDTSRRKEDLERYTLDSMEMVGVINNNNKLWGLVRLTAGPSKGDVVWVTEGNYMGINHGRIIQIEEQQMEILTLVPDSRGCWEERAIYMALAQ